MFSFCKHTRPGVHVGLYWEGFRLHCSSPTLGAWLQEADFLAPIAANCRWWVQHRLPQCHRDAMPHKIHSTLKTNGPRTAVPRAGSNLIHTHCTKKQYPSMGMSTLCCSCHGKARWMRYPSTTAGPCAKPACSARCFTGRETLLAALPMPQNQNWGSLHAHGTGNELQFPPPQRSSDPHGIEEMGWGEWEVVRWGLHSGEW